MPTGQNANLGWHFVRDFFSVVGILSGPTFWYKTERPYFANNGPAVEIRNPAERSDSFPISLLTGIVRDCVGAKPLAMLHF